VPRCAKQLKGFVFALVGEKKKNRSRPGGWGMGGKRDRGGEGGNKWANRFWGKFWGGLFFFFFFKKRGQTHLKGGGEGV